jgi:hypothetical protein
MPDLLAHAFIAYTVATRLSWHYDWLTPAYKTALMAGAFIPDLTKSNFSSQAAPSNSSLAFRSTGSPSIPQAVPCSQFSLALSSSPQVNADVRLLY